MSVGAQRRSICGTPAELTKEKALLVEKTNRVTLTHFILCRG